MAGNRISNKKTLWEKKGGRTFHGDLDTGKYGEKVLAARMNSFPSVATVRDISDSKRGIADDIDVEIKTDLMAHKTGNFAYEEYSHKNPGCFARTKADHILYFIKETDMVYVLNPVKFREFIAEMKMDKEKAASLKVRPSGMGEGAFGYLVPITVLAETDVLECTFTAKQHLWAA